ncbi:Casein kinase II, regulatory subunit [Cordyceps fumosorosea ARSEF 2679]|uniref:Casein kinase II, regulatory subunit n=1 Tax=Cordyceps fumosorosea (strain ARSEF 2679) TaxID=1081104 RepID=A0A168ESA4_CORFA|nr:Casein kinase II, regulatory subunit [Cordyceps fumosorosea ARSEF 2679]OAA74151.1 Casein kinase II, regulatory subunit [Cordyceps fumosorosea ARSEF 2679]
MPKDESPAQSPIMAVAESSSSAPLPKRTAPTEAAESAPRMKRGKYTSLACNECKRRKLKCLPTADGDSCERCINRKLLCIFAVNSPKGDKKRDEGNQIQILGDELAHVRQELANLSQAVFELRQHRSPHAAGLITSAGTDPVSTRSPSSVTRDAVPKHPQFVGPTRAAYGLMIAERSLTRMGIPDSPSSPSGSGPSSPEAQPPLPPTPQQLQKHQQRQSTDLAVPTAPPDVEFWAQCTPAEAARLMGVFEEEVESVYPYIDILELAARSEQILRILRQPELLEDEALAGSSTGRPLTVTDIDLAKVAIAVGVATEARGKNDLCVAIAASIEQHTARISQTEVSLRGIQLLISLSIYYFHSDDELLAWRTIGVAAREALEMGLHRKRSLYDNFSDPASRQRALRVFCCCYILDRRWSFGTSLSFALVDSDIDPSLMELELDSPYLKCMVGYARLCSKLWEAIPPFGSPNQSIPHELAYALDASAQEWLDSIPPHLQMRHYPRGAAANGNGGNNGAGGSGNNAAGGPYTSTMRTQQQQPRVLHRLRALLYLRGNLTRISIYQHHLISPAAVAADPDRARVAVDLARDTVQVLVHLHATSDIYSRQQNAFNYFLASAFAVISLALCHAPHLFAAPCTQSFMDAAGLVKGFSRHSMASKRLWKSIRGLSPRLKSLGVGANTKEQQQQQQQHQQQQHQHSQQQQVGPGRGAVATGVDPGQARWRGPYGQMYNAGDARQQVSGGGQPSQAAGADNMWNYNVNPAAPGGQVLSGSGNAEPLPGMNPDILSLFDSLGDDAMFSSGSFDPSVYGGMETDGEGGDISRLFLQGLM